MAVAQAEILDKIASMTVLELSELIKAMEDKFGVSAAACATNPCGAGPGTTLPANAYVLPLICTDRRRPVRFVPAVKPNVNEIFVIVSVPWSARTCDSGTPVP